MPGRIDPQTAARDREQSMAAANARPKEAKPRKVTMGDVRRSENARMARLLGPKSAAEQRFIAQRKAAVARKSGGARKGTQPGRPPLDSRPATAGPVRVSGHTRQGHRVSGYTRRRG